MSLFKQIPPETYFSTRRVQTSEELRAVFGLRYQVYCEERGFLPAERYPNRLESDEYDLHAAHFATFDQDGQVVAAARLVPHCRARGFPYQHYCTLFEDAPVPEIGVSVEVSRLVLNRNHRRPPGGGCIGTVVIGLYREMYLFSKKRGISHWYAAMERPLVRLLARYGFSFDVAGPEADYYGPVAAHVADLPVLEQRLAAESPALHQWFCSRW